ncbi:MAG: NADH-quinone oxidoreductase subunit J family protein [Anaerolineae bacterium]
MLIFSILAIVAVATSIAVIAQRNVVYSTLFLLVHFCCLAGLYILLNAQFVAVTQVIVYAGAVVVLFLFVVMLLGLERARELPDPRRYQWIIGSLLGILLVAGLIWALLPQAAETAPPLTRTDNVRQIGTALLTQFAIPFELTALVLLVALIGSLVLAKRNLEG